MGAFLPVSFQIALADEGPAPGPRSYKTNPFSRFAKWTARAAGHPAVFGVALGVILVWAVTGPIFAFSDTWQLVINTGTTIVTFLMVFLIQITQNRDTEAMQPKLDVIRAMQGRKACEGHLTHP